MGFLQCIFVRNFMFDLQGINSAKLLGRILCILSSYFAHQLNAGILQGFTVNKQPSNRLASHSRNARLMITLLPVSKMFLSDTEEGLNSRVNPNTFRKKQF
jgi:hypothetical protein